jgi:hypothetical protein
MHLRNVLLAALALAVVAFAQNPITADSPFQVRYATNLDTGTAYIHISNSGATGAPALGPGFSGPGNICVNVYAFSPDEQLVACCSCLVTPNGLATLDVKRDVLSNTLTGVTPTSAVVKLLATVAGTGAGPTCANSAALAASATRANGLLAWGTSVKPTLAGGFSVTETAFTPATLSTGEAASITGRCAAILGNGSGAGLCRSCLGNNCTLAASAPSLGFLAVGTLINVPIPISGGTPPYNCSLTGGQLPSGLALNGCSITGGPTQNTAFNYTISVNDTAGCVAQVTGSGVAGCGFSNLSATCPQISSRRGSATVGQAITPLTVPVTGGLAPFICSSTGLPNGLSVSSDCTIFGVPTVSGTFPYTISFKDTCNAAGAVSCSVTVQ